MPCGWTLNVRVHLLQSHVSWNLQKLQTWTPGRVGHFILRAVAIQAINPQNALTRINFHSPKSLPPPHRDHAVATVGQLAILPETSSSCPSRTPLNHGQLSGFFFLFLFNDFENFGNILLKLINYSCSSYPTRASYSGQVDEFRNPMKNELKTRPWKKPVFETISNTGFLQSRVFNLFFIGFLKSCKFS